MATTGPPAYGRRLVPQVLDELATTDPERVYAAVPKTSDVKDGYLDITVASLARCVDFMADWIGGKFGRSHNFETITYVGLSDLRGIVILLAAIKTGYKLFVPSPRNTASVNWHLMNQVNSKKLLYAAETLPLIKPLQELVPSASFDAVPSLQTMLDSNPDLYLYAKSFEEARDDPIVVLHSSGSTGLPKPITITHSSVAAHDNDHNLAAPTGREKMDTTVFTLDGEERRLYLILPFFHLGGFVFFMDHAILNNLTLVLGPPHLVPDAVLLKEIAQQQKLRAIMVVPAVLEQLLHDPQGTDLLKDLDFVACAGAPLPSSVGDRVAGIVKLYIFIGSTETFPLPELVKSPEDWQYHEFNPSLEHEMRPYDEKTKTFELIIFADDTTRDKAPVYHNLPGVNPFYTKDLFTQHPTRPNLYKYYGRRDDIIVLANGEKVNPIPLEQVQGDPSLKGALLIGTGRVQTALIIEPREPLDEAGSTHLLETLWPRIEEANALISGQGRVLRGMVICASPDKPFYRTGKGTIVRKLTEEAYKDEIERLYSAFLGQERLATVSLKASNNMVYEQAAITDFLRQVLAVSFSQVTAIGENEDFFAHGLDSIQTLHITANLKRNLGRLTTTSVAWITPRVIFRHSTLAHLSRILAKFLNDSTVPAEDSNATRASAVDDAVTRHTASLPPRKASPETAVISKAPIHTIAILGSTGYIASHLVAKQLRDPAISRIYCLDRTSDAQSRLEPMLYYLDKDLDISKLSFIMIVFGAPRLGLSQDQYQQISREVDVIVYNSWRLDFGLAIHSFEPFLHATRELVELSLTSQHNMHIVFISSMSSVEGLALTGATVPEAAVEDSLAAMNTGYGQSKLAAERILAAASRQSGIPISIVRVGQVGGSRQGGHIWEWADQPWISAVVRTSKTLGLFPSTLAPVDWVPVDDLVTILGSVILHEPASDPELPEFFNVVSERQPWIILRDVLQALEPTSVFEAVSLPDWVNKIRQLSDLGSADVAKLPALRLLDFYQILGSGTDHLKYATERTRAVSGVGLAPLTKDLLESWLKTWNR